MPLLLYAVPPPASLSPYVGRLHAADVWAAVPHAHTCQQCRASALGGLKQSTSQVSSLPLHPRAPAKLICMCALQKQCHMLSHSLPTTLTQARFCACPSHHVLAFLAPTQVPPGPHLFGIPIALERAYISSLHTQSTLC